MASLKKYDLVFKGELVRGADMSATKANIAKLFKISLDKVESMFSGKSITLKKGLALDAANKYRVAIKKAGARVDLVPQEQVQENPVEKAATGGSAEVAPIVNTTKVESPAAVRASETPKTSPVAERTSQFGFSLAPAGGELLLPEEKQTTAPRDVDTSAFTLRTQEGNLLEDSEYHEPAPVEVRVDGMTVAEVGSDLLLPEEKKAAAEVELDLGEYSLAEPGVKIGPDKPAPPPAPDVSNISLAENGD